MKSTRTYISTKLTEDQTKKLIEDFLYRLGDRLRIKRTKINLTQTELANCIDISQSELSKIESGQADSNVSILPLYSAYCDFPMYELFPKDESQHILDTFASAVTITVERKKRQAELQKKKDDIKQWQKQVGEEKVLKAQVFEINGKEVYEPVQQKTTNKSLREQYKDAEMHTEFQPYNEMEFCDFVRNKDTELLDSVLNAGQFLKQIENVPHKETLRGALADYIVDELVINQVAHKGSDEVSRRAYAYYRMLYQQRMNDSPNNNKNLQ